MSPKTRLIPADSAPRRAEDEATERERAEGRAMDSTMWSIVGHMAASLALYGGLGYLLGRWLGHPILLLVGALFGLIVSLVYTVWLANRREHEQ